jgi:RNA polymerase sigma-70 factor (ECF subfamily)
MSEWLTTSTLLERLRNFDDAVAWQRIQSRFQRPVIALAEKLGLSRADAEDVAQETLAAFADGVRRGTFDRSKGRLSAWLFGIAYRQAAGARRKRGRVPAGALDGSPDSMLAKIPEASDFAAAWDAEWERTVLDQCLAQVRQEVEPQTFEAFRLAVLENQSTESTCAATGLSREAVYVAKHRVLKRIREARSELEDAI